ncbi:SusC/RagA family TonB-linked outer membrane protein [Zhouia sp. PK063]|uniref:SusC/RagA family TonB-linked outer membrane protein n=1 Tax=Zhouia sp. PK063 TaxID=3373602 RepID=UPI0037B940BE
MKTRLRMILTLFLALFVHISFAQEKSITGTVLDPDGLPLPGVNVVVKGTKNGTQTDFDGKYSIGANVGQTLQFSFIGYKTIEVNVGKSTTTADVKMFEDSQSLDEVIVTGVAGATSRKKLPITVAKVDAEDLENVPAASAASALQGKVSGVTVTNLGRPGQGANIILRGAKNLFGSQEPLVILDGVFVEGGLSDINIDDIASFEIVKGASAASLYGSRAGNGVIVLTSKRGKEGRTQVTIRSEVGYSEIGQKMDINKSHHYKLASDFDSYKGQFTKYDGVTYPANYQGVYSPDVVGARVEEEDLYSDNPYGVYYDFQDLFFKKGLNNTLYSSVSSGNEKSNLYASFENSKFEGILVETDGYSRNSFRLNGDFKINDWLKFNASNLFIKTVDNTPAGGTGLYRSSTRVSPDANIFADNPDGQPYFFLPDQWSTEVTNPLYSLYSTNNKSRNQRFLGSYALNIKFASWVNVDAEYSFENENYHGTSYTPYTAYALSSTEDQGFEYSKGGLSKDTFYRLGQKAQFTANFAQSWNDLNLKGKLSYLMENRHYEYFYTSGSDFKYRDLPTLDNFDSSDIRSNSDSSDDRAQNFFAIASFDYKDRYIFDTMFRYDGSSLFGANEKWNPYYRVSGAYRISEDFPIQGIDEFKIHASYGTAGQRPGFSWQFEQTPLSYGVLGTNRVAGNPNLKPSETSELEAGINLNFLKKFSLEANYSKSVTSDQFMLVNLFSPANGGKNRQWQNVGNVEFNTFEATLNINAISTEDISWDLGINFSKTKNEITKLKVAQMKVGPDDLFLIKEGEEFGSMYGRRFVYTLDEMAAQLPDGESIGDYSVNADGVVVKTADIGTGDEKPFIKQNEDGSTAYEKIGNQNADFRVGLTSNFSYKNFSFYMLWDWKQGGDIYNRNYQWNTIDFRSAIVDQAGKPENQKKTTNYYAALYDVNENNGFWVEDGSFVKLRETSVSYTFDDTQLKGFLYGFFDSVKLSIIGRNLLTFSDYKGWDPEVAQYSGDTQQYYSVDYGVYPNQRSFAVSLQLKF